jgi:hypothetical protein
MLSVASGEVAHPSRFGKGRLGRAVIDLACAAAPGLGGE